MSTQQQQFRLRVKELGFSLRALSLRWGMSENYLSEILQNGRLRPLHFRALEGEEARQDGWLPPHEGDDDPAVQDSPDT